MENYLVYFTLLYYIFLVSLIILVGGSPKESGLLRGVFRSPGTRGETKGWRADNSPPTFPFFFCLVNLSILKL